MLKQKCILEHTYIIFDFITLTSATHVPNKSMSWQDITQSRYCILPVLCLFGHPRLSVLLQ